MRKLVRKADIRIVPLLSAVYLLNYLDRGNVGNAKVLNQETNDDLLSQTGMTSTGYAISLTLFSVAYAVFEVPSNWILKRYVRPSLWLGFLLFAWGATTIGFAAVHTYPVVVVLRLLIGIFEAGFFPGMNQSDTRICLIVSNLQNWAGIVYYTTFWYRIEERGLRIAFVAAHANLAGAFGGVIAYGVGHLNGRSGLQGFRWLFIIEGIITVIMAFILAYFLPDYPSRTKWLSQTEKTAWEARLREQGAGYSRDHATRKEVLDACFSPRMLLHYFIYVSVSTHDNHHEDYRADKYAAHQHHSSGVLYILHSNHCDRSRLRISSRPASYHPTVGCGIHFCTHILLLSRPLQRQRLSHHVWLYTGWHRVADICLSPERRLYREIWMPRPRICRGFPMRGSSQRVGKWKFSQHNHHCHHHGLEQLGRRYWSDHCAVDMDSWGKGQRLPHR